MARCRPASSNSAVVTVPERLPKLAATARLYPEDAPDVVAVLRANLRFARSPPDNVRKVSSALLNESARSSSAFACSRVQIIRRPEALPAGIEDVDPREARDGAAVAHRVALRRLSLAVAERAAKQIRGPAADHVARPPELRRVRLVGEIAELCRDPAVLDLPERLAAELEVVALVVDAVAAISLDQHAVVGRRDDVPFAD